MCTRKTTNDSVWSSRPHNDLLCVYRKHKHEQREPEQWLVVAPSALLKLLGLTGKGLYAARPFKKYDIIGKYEGNVAATYPTQREVLECQEAKELTLQGVDKLVAVKAKKGWALIDATNCTSYISMANDPISTGLPANCYLTEGGYLTLRRKYVQAFDFNKSIEENIESELMYSYGSRFWGL